MKRLNNKYFKILIAILPIIAILLTACATPTPKASPTGTAVAPQASLLDRMTAGESRINALESADATLGNRITAIEKTDKSTSVTTAQLNEVKNMAESSKSKADEALSTARSIQSSADTARSTADSLKAQVTTLETKITETQAEIAKLKATPTPTPTTDPNGSDVTSEDGINIVIKNLGMEILEGTANFDSEESLKITVSNTLATDVTGLRFYITLTPDDTLATKLIETPMSLSGDISCTVVSAGSEEFVFKTSKLSISAGKSKVYYLTPAIGLAPKAYYPYVDANGNYTDSSTCGNKLNATNPEYGTVEGALQYLDNSNNPTSFKYTNALNVLTNEANGKSKTNSSYISDDLGFDASVEIIDFNY